MRSKFWGLGLKKQNDNFSMPPTMKYKSRNWLKNFILATTNLRNTSIFLPYFREEYEKLNKICETLYHENESLKNQLSEIDFSLKQKYESERQKNQDLLAEI